ncbi:MAG: ASKHA domain-containing protein [Eisenbergiella sp.]
MGIGNRERILVTSTAAGPAFEGGNIVHGSGSIPGAICNVKLEDGRTARTIQNEPPSGIWRYGSD